MDNKLIWDPTNCYLFKVEKWYSSSEKCRWSGNSNTNYDETIYLKLSFLISQNNIKKCKIIFETKLLKKRERRTLIPIIREKFKCPLWNNKRRRFQAPRVVLWLTSLISKYSRVSSSLIECPTYMALCYI